MIYQYILGGEIVIHNQCNYISQFLIIPLKMVDGSVAIRVANQHKGSKGVIMQ